MSAVSFGAALKFSDGWFGFLVPLLLWMISFYFANKIDRLKKKYDIQTYKEILDYMENGEVIQHTPRDEKKFKREKIIIVTCFTAAFGILVLISIYLFQLL